MFPFIWWLGGVDTGDAGLHEGGADFLRRRVIMATIAQAWSPLALSPAGDYLAESSQVSLSSLNVAQWSDRGPSKNHLTGSNPTWPDFSAGGWGTSASVRFSGGPFLINSGALGTAFNGTNTPTSLFWYLDFDDSEIDQTICAWDHSSGGAATSILRIDNVVSGGALRYTRQGDSGSPVSVAGGAALGNNKVTVGMTYSSEGLATLYVGGVSDGTSDMSSVGACTFDRFRVGTGPGAIDALTAHVKFGHVGVRAYSPAEMLLLHRFAMENFP